MVALHLREEERWGRTGSSLDILQKQNHFDSDKNAATLQQHLCFARQAACFRGHFSQPHDQVGRHERYILSSIKFGTISKLALVATHNVIVLLAALPTVSTF